jgi:hypothetical protein
VIDFAGYKTRIYEEATLLERVTYMHFFEEKNKQQVLKALKAYQNSDGGFGHGLERDVTCPSSNSVAAESALFYIDMIDDYSGSIIQDISYWVKHNMQYDGKMLPPFDLYHYPYQEWWEDEDLLNRRVFSIIGSLIKAKVIQKDTYSDKLNEYIFESREKLDLSYYSYPYFLYEYAVNGQASPVVRYLLANIDKVLEGHRDHYPLFSRYWYWIIPILPKKVILREMERIEEEIFKPVKYIDPYPDLENWDLTFTLDAMIIYSKIR